MSATRARLALAGLVVLLIWGLLPSSKPAARRLPPPGSGDSALFMKVIGRIAAGEPYYSALGHEMRRDNYPATSSFNWRTPAHLVAVAYATVPVATLVLKLLTLTAVLATAAVLARFGRTAPIAGTFAQMGALATAFRPDAVGVPDIWAGVLIALSVCAYYRAWWVAGALLGTGAVFMRELAAPYCLACGLLAFASRSRRREAGLWVVAGTAYAVYYGLHFWQVSSHQLPGDLAHVQPWQQWNGIRFTLSTIGVNGWLSFVPRWAAVVYMVVALAGTVSQEMTAQAKAALVTYFVLFAFVGLPFNFYWGFITAPLWAFGVAHGADGLRRLVTAATARWRENGGPAEAASRS